MAVTKAKAIPMMKKFQGETKVAATAAATRWSTDLTSHEAVKVDGIDVTKRASGKFVATITYYE